MRLIKLIAVTVLLASCGGSSPSKPVPKIETTTFDASLGVDLANSVKLPSGMYYRDITVGTGAVVVPGDTLHTYYTGAFTDGSIFDSRRPSDPTPFAFTIGVVPAQVIGGWDQGLRGMAEGGERQLIIPPDLGYGADDYGGVIPGNSILVFRVAVVKVFPPQ